MYKAHYFFILLGLVLMLYIFKAVRKKKMTIDDSILWTIGAVVVFLIGCFPESIVWLSGLIGVAYPPSLLFLLSFAFILLLVLNHSLTISELKEKNKELIQDAALLDARVRRLEEQVDAFEAGQDTLKSGSRQEGTR